MRFAILLLAALTLSACTIVRIPQDALPRAAGSAPLAASVRRAQAPVRTPQAQASLQTPEPGKAVAAAEMLDVAAAPSDLPLRPLEPLTAGVTEHARNLLGWSFWLSFAALVTLTLNLGRLRKLADALRARVLGLR